MTGRRNALSQNYSVYFFIIWRRRSLCYTSSRILAISVQYNFYVKPKWRFVILLKNPYRAKNIRYSKYVIKDNKNKSLYGYEVLYL
jgi:hypothetical protein